MIDTAADTAASIERHLMSRGTWVPASEICDLFGVNDRALRAADDQPGLCTRFAISSKKGLKHIDLATTGEWLEFKLGTKKHAIRTLMRVRDLGRRRLNSTRTISRPPLTFEKDSGQAVWDNVDNEARMGDMRP